ncbi:MAG: DUF3859 domain-containing protein [Pontiellaceae bacterium]|nr:DUF3859 domain-containing protein [Pontiellaceae bacterium]MBN2784206.1 DUF3859 domain-containing protein [Pontiellaceae bacterium]
MARKKADVEVHSCGLYDGWDRESKELPRLVKMTSEIEARLDVEFGYILRIRNARNCKLRFCIEHPPFKDRSGNPAPPFTGELYVKNNDYRFFLGDTVWAPVEDKRGRWRLKTWVDNELVADRTIDLV